MNKLFDLQFMSTNKHNINTFKLIISPYNKINILKVANIDMRILSFYLIKD